ncbi:NUDIX hydrolase [Arthrobacter sp. NPDC090010]|uniref:NUDIX hydrolase n=1 Tax=Arthrobacter sp. NPDC090010 TaxID=3363942 RepID=UPI003829184C
MPDSVTLLDSASDAINSWEPLTDREASAQNEFRTWLAHGQDVLTRHPLRTHLTASTFVFDDELRRLLLLFHGKGGFWVQPGGHLEDGDDSLKAAALREVEEETGLSPAQLQGIRVADLDHHELSGSFGHCSSHLDIGVVALTAGTPPVRSSEESKHIGWFDVDDLPSPLPPGFTERLAGIRRRLH